MLATSPADRHALIAQARQALLADGAAVRTEVEPWIARSWWRCLARGLEPEDLAAFRRCLEGFRRNLSQMTQEDAQ